jgi:hypothetical protein
MDLAGSEKSKLGSSRRKAIASASSSGAICLAENTSHLKIAWTNAVLRKLVARAKKRA